MFRYITLVLFIAFGMSQTTGKVSGIIVEKESKDPLPGANIYLVKTHIIKQQN